MSDMTHITLEDSLRDLFLLLTDSLIGISDYIRFSDSRSTGKSPSRAFSLLSLVQSLSPLGCSCLHLLHFFLSNPLFIPSSLRLHFSFIFLCPLPLFCSTLPCRFWNLPGPDQHRIIPPSPPFASPRWWFGSLEKRPVLCSSFPWRHLCSSVLISIPHSHSPPSAPLPILCLPDSFV